MNEYHYEDLWIIIDKITHVSYNKILCWTGVMTVSLIVFVLKMNKTRVIYYILPKLVDKHGVIQPRVIKI